MNRIMKLITPDARQYVPKEIPRGSARPARTLPNTGRCSQ